MPVPLLLIGSDMIAVLGVLILSVTVWSSVENVPEHEMRALTVFGGYRKLLKPGINVIPPFVSITYPIDMRTQTLEVPQQETTTEDGRLVTAEAVVTFVVVDAQKAFLEVESHQRAVKNIAQTTLRVVIGDMELDEMSDSATLNYWFSRELETVTSEWGIRIEHTDVHDIHTRE